MKYFFRSISILFLFSSFYAEGQSDVTIRKKDFKNGNKGFDEAWKHVTAGDAYFSQKGVWYGNAYEEYNKAISYNNSNAELNYKLGASALLSDNKEKAAPFLLRAGELKKDVADDILLLTARSFQYAGRFQEAIELFGKYISSRVKKSDEDLLKIKRCIDECNSAIILTKDSIKVTVNNLGGTINSNSDDYSEIITSDGKKMYFASRREIEKSDKRNTDTKYDENIFMSARNGDSWSTSVPALKNLTSGNCEAPLFITPDGDRLYIYAGYENGGDIRKVSINKKGEWKTPEPVEFPVNSSGSETSFCISPSGNEIFFVTNNPKDGLGGKDIYFITKIGEKKWSKPQNAGNFINTAFDEECVRFSPGGDTLFFSSRGHNSIGGFDIFYSVRGISGLWDKARNYGYPVNTQWDDLFYLPSTENDSTFFFVSNRSGGLGGLDIYRGTIHHSLSIIPEVSITPAKANNVAAGDTAVVVKKQESPEKIEKER